MAMFLELLHVHQRGCGQDLGGVFEEGGKVDGDLVHLLLHCPALIIARKNLLDMWVQRAVRYPALYSLVLQVLQGTDTLKMLFILSHESGIKNN